AEVSGLSRRVIFTHIVLPIALRTSVRPLGSVLINIILTSSVLSTITLNELTGQARIVSSDTFRPFEVYVVLLAVYAVMTYLVSTGIAMLHRRLNRDLQPEVN
ncbi:MAG: ABC transporter permease subunit, partial [Ancalomicrobiaceae bacterium]|nr:ABC transporter permease subunit [Ancalomicrobiaceae bacterium]